MKKSELKEYIKDRIEELLTVKVNKNPATLTDTEKNNIIQSLRTSGRSTDIGGTKKPVDFIPETDVNELARPAEEFRIPADFRSKAENVQTGGPVSPNKLNTILDILDSILADGFNNTTFSKIAQAYDAPMRSLYPTLAALRDAGALESLSAPQADEDEIEGGYEEDEMDGDVEDVEVTDTEVEDIPDFEPEAEPEVGSLETSQTTLDPITKDANIFVVDNSDLIQSLINNYKNSRTRIAEIRDESDSDLSASDYKKAMQQSKEASLQILGRKLEELVTKINRLEPETQDAVLKTLEFKFRSVDANKLFNMVAKKLGKTIEPSLPDEEIIDFNDEEITEDSGVEDVDHNSSSFKDYDSIYERMIKLVNYKG